MLEGARKSQTESFTEMQKARSSVTGKTQQNKATSGSSQERENKKKRKRKHKGRKRERKERKDRERNKEEKAKREKKERRKGGGTVKQCANMFLNLVLNNK